MKAKILVIEDQKPVRELIGSVLEREGMEVKACATAETGLKELEEGPYDLVTLDFDLPDQNGLELLKNIDRQKKLPSILVSDPLDHDSILRAFDSGADDFICKPFRPDNLVARVNEYLHQYGTKDESVEVMPAAS